ncbi:zinc-binding alcohol dehydrogenase family protein [Neptunomonas concharum]|uniref:Zinc-type alcohol dehydrogenase-like protein n=1 Tax=Neptunomonas concharum TaxID=1031538 RepID=A0A5P1R6M6_9GAMM|nr:zinc-binding alcohol dehydrogenase family protein [Neptunomonas concharum]QEQ95317.1 zinc-binding alcohol dehydrogenase family protein [Neptunomonas concharum]
MKAIGYTHSLPITDAKSLQDVELPQPVASGHDLLVRIEAISVNPVDTKVRQRAEPEAGHYKVLGWDAVGVVEAVGDSVSLFKIGDRVWYAGDLTRQGSNAEYQLVDERIVGKAPSSLSSAQAAALPLTSITAWELLFDRLSFDLSQSYQGSQLLIIGAAGGVGSILVQLAKQITGLTVIGTASRPESEQWVKALGADYVINHRNPIHEELSKLGINEVSHVISLNQTDQHFASIVEALKPQGKLALIDDPAEPLDIMQLKRKSLSLHWEFMYTRSMFTTDDMIEQHRLLNALADLIDQGVIKTTIGEHFGSINAENLKRAHAALETNTAIGKIILEGF